MTEEARVRDAESTPTQDRYVSHALRWIGKVFLIGIATAVLDAVLLSAGGPPSYIFVFLVNIGASLLVIVLLFRQIDTLVLERMAQLET